MIYDMIWILKFLADIFFLEDISRSLIIIFIIIFITIIIIIIIIIIFTII